MWLTVWLHQTPRQTGNRPHMAGWRVGSCDRQSRKWKLTAVRWLDRSCFFIFKYNILTRCIRKCVCPRSAYHGRGSVIRDKTEEADGKCRSESCVLCTLMTLQRYQLSLTPRTGCCRKNVQCPAADGTPWMAGYISNQYSWNVFWVLTHFSTMKKQTWPSLPH